MSRMRQSIAPTNFSTRLSNALVSLRGHDDCFVLEDVLKLYAENPAQLEAEFLRVPGAGRATLNELKEYLDKYVYENNTIGRVTVMSQRDASANRGAIDRVLAHVDANSADYQRLRDVQEALKSSRVMIEQPDDTRREFRTD